MRSRSFGRGNPGINSVAPAGLIPVASGIIASQADLNGVLENLDRFPPALE